MLKARFSGWLITLGMLTACVAASVTTSSFITADEAGNTLTRINANGSRLPLAVPVAPHNVQVSADGKWVLATGMPKGHEHAGHAMSGTLLVIPTDSFNEESIRSISLGEHLAHVVTDASGKTAYVTDSASDRVAVVDIASGDVKKWISVGVFPHGARINPINGDLYTANVNDGTMSVVDAVANKETQRVPVGGKPIQVAVSPDGKKVYVTLAKDSAVGVVDVAQHRKIKTISVDSPPAQIYADPLGRYMYVADQGSKEHPGHTLSVIDIALDTVVKTIRTGLMPHGVVASRDGQFIYVTNMGDNTVSQMDTKNFTIVNSYAVGELPNGITLVEGKN